MTHLKALFAACALVFSPSAFAQDWSIAIHGGAGTLSRDDMTAEKEAAYRAALQEALDAGAAILAEGGSAMDASRLRSC